MKNLVSIFALTLLMITTAIVSYGTQNSTAGDRTLENLQTAFNGESNANARYVAFAVLLQKPKKSTPAITVT